MGADYDSAVVETFRKNSLRTVFLVDDSFPKYSDMAVEKYRDTFKEWERAQHLYKAFHDLHLPCDIENSFEPGDEKMIERLRKCDLIVLDYLLDGNDPAKSIEILRRLAESRHFNTVVVYTKEKLDDVWLHIAASLRPDLKYSPYATAHEAEAAWWEIQEPAEYVALVSGSGMAAFLTSGLARVDWKETKKIKDFLKEKLGGAELNRNVLCEMVYRKAVDGKRLPAPAGHGGETASSRSLQGRFDEGTPRWLQCRGCFIALAAKVEDADEADQLLSGLDNALLDWKPNFLQILVSEIQNDLELEHVAADPHMFSDVVRQVGLSHYLLQQLEAEDDPDSAIESMIDRIVETLRSKMSAETKLREFAGRVLADLRAGLGDGIKSADAVENATKFAHALERPDDINAMSRLNAFLSTEPFARSRITTGSVFKSGDDGFWMVASPACDLTGREPGGQKWMKELHPVRSFMAVRLSTADNLKTALKVANHGKHAFVIHDGQPISLTVLNDKTSAPDTEVFFAADAGRVSKFEGRAIFAAHRIIRNNAVPEFSPSADFTVIGQLRPAYANRILQMTGLHLARIGIDFFTVGGVRDAAE